jgi:hypothetical protein
MNKTKVALGVLCVVVTAAFAYDQIQSQTPEPGLETTNGKVLNNASTRKSTEPTPIERGLDKNTTLSAPPSVPSLGVSNPPVGSPVASSNNKVRVQAQSHNKPADHSGARQPKAHGHEHEQQRRHPEDNSIIPPGEPKKPVPKQENNS